MSPDWRITGKKRRRWASHEKGITKPESGKKTKEQKREDKWDVEKKTVQKEKYWCLSEDGHLTLANPFPTGGRSAAGRSRVTLSTLSCPWARTEERAVLDHDGGPTVWHELLVPGWDRKPRPSLLSIHQSFSHFYFQKSRMWHLLFCPNFNQVSVHSVFFFVVTFSAAECPQMLPCSSPWQKSWLRKIILAKPTIFSIIFWLKMLIHPSRPTTYVSASILQQDFL